MQSTIQLDLLFPAPWPAIIFIVTPDSNSGKGSSSSCRAHRLAVIDHTWFFLYAEPAQESRGILSVSLFVIGEISSGSFTGDEWMNIAVTTIIENFEHKFIKDWIGLKNTDVFLLATVRWVFYTVWFSQRFSKNTHIGTKNVQSVCDGNLIYSVSVAD